MLRITVQEDDGLPAIAEIPSEQGPALRSAINEIRNEVGARLEGSFTFAKEFALTNAASALGTLAAAINKVIPNEDPDYE